MGCTVREKSIRTCRKFRPNLNSDSIVDDLAVDDNLKSVKTLDISDQKEEGENSRCPILDESDWGYYTEDQLEDLLLKNLEFLYSEALCKIISLGYDEDTALKSILRNGHSYGDSDVLSNILHNSLAYLNSNGNVNDDKSELVFGDLKQLEEYSLAGMLCLIQQVRPQLSRGDAMWCLLMSDLHIGRATTLEIPVLHPSCNDDREILNNTQCWNHHSLSTRGVSVPVPIRPSLGMSGISGPCKFHGGWSLGGGSLPVTDVSIPKTALTSIGPPPQSFNISHSKKMSVIKRNAAAKFATRFQVDPKAETQVEGCPSSSITFCADQIRKTGTEVLMDNGMTLVKQDTEASCETKVHAAIVTAASELFPCLTTESKISTEQFEESKGSRNLDVVSSILGSLGSANLDGKAEGGDDQRNRMIINLMHQIRVLEVQLKERIDWAHQKAMQAARKLSSDLTELKMLRMEREETLRLKKGKQALEDTTMKRLSDMENSLRKASGQVDRANAAVRRLETENAEIRAEMEASKLSASESVTTCLEVAKREKKYLKKLLAWEKQKSKFQDEIAEEKQKIAQLQQQLHLIKEAQKETEGKWKQEIKAREIAVARAEEERRAKEAAEVAVKRRQEAMRRKIDIDFQRHKDDIQRLEQELSRLKASAETSQLKCSSNTLCTGDAAAAKALKETNARMLHELQKLQEPSQKEANCDRECLLCKKAEVSVVFLPCAHQILCVNCNEDHDKQSKTSCPACSVRIEQRVHVYGASS